MELSFVFPVLSCMGFQAKGIPDGASRAGHWPPAREQSDGWSAGTEQPFIQSMAMNLMPYKKC
jgi:hypothetical protein